MRYALLSCLCVLIQTSAQGDEQASIPIGVAAADVTPRGPIRLVGYESRKVESEGVESRLKARALAIGGDDADDTAGGGPVVLIAVENLGIPAVVSEEVARRLKARAGLPRERLVISATHTHSAPALKGGVDFIFGRPLDADEQSKVDAYTNTLIRALERVALSALADRRPGRLAWGRGEVGFAANRRVLKDGKWTGFGVNPDGPTDRGLPVLRACNADGTVRAFLVGYACHCTTLGGDFNKVGGDWAGYACEALEREYPNAASMVVIGCGGDANPEPRTTLDDARKHGESVAREVIRLHTEGRLTAITGKVAAKYKVIDLPFGTPPTREQLAAREKLPGAEGYFARTMGARLDRGESTPRTVPLPV